MTFQDFTKQFTDAYERKARLGPMLCALAPVLVVLVGYTPIDLNFSLKSITAVLLYGSACTLFSAFARNAGKAKEPGLKAEWGGWPSTLIFRHSDTTIDAVSKSNIHSAMAQLVANAPAPTVQQENEGAEKADAVYRAWSEHLRKEARRGSKKYPFVFRENVSYGFHRNLYGLKEFAIVVLILCTIVTGLSAFLHWRQSNSVPTQDIAFSITFLLAILFWVFCVTRGSVKRAAQDYALRLIDDCVPKPKAQRRPRPCEPLGNES